MYVLYIFQEADIPSTIEKDDTSLEQVTVQSSDNMYTASSNDVLEKMTRRLYECNYCTERFSNTEALRTHSAAHLKEDRVPPPQNKMVETDLLKGEDNGNDNQECVGKLDKVLQIYLKRVDDDD